MECIVTFVHENDTSSFRLSHDLGYSAIFDSIYERVEEISYNRRVPINSIDISIPTAEKQLKTVRVPLGINENVKIYYSISTITDRAGEKITLVKISNKYISDVHIVRKDVSFTPRNIYFFTNNSEKQGYHAIKYSSNLQNSVDEYLTSL